MRKTVQTIYSHDTEVYSLYGNSRTKRGTRRQTLAQRSKENKAISELLMIKQRQENYVQCKQPYFLNRAYLE